jgi:queuine tRNA-ribosyltransferase
MAASEVGEARAAAPRPSPFRVRSTDPECAARRGSLLTAHGEIGTPIFMPVATRGTVKGLAPSELRRCGAGILLANAYHLGLRPGIEILEELGGLHRFMGWDGAILTDSGGYQIMSLAALRRVSDAGVEFRSHLDGSKLFLTPESVIDLQSRMGVDIVMPLDECLASTEDRARVEAAMRRTTDWAQRSAAQEVPADRHVFGIVQGGLYADLRRQHAGRLAGFEFPGYAVGGLSVGEERVVTREMAAETAAALPAGRPRYLMGVGLPQDLLRFIGMGYDLFDCVMPTRNGRNGTCFTARGRKNLRLARFARDPRPLDDSCSCAACRNFSRGYLRHLTVAGEMLGAQLASLHNVHFYLDLMAQARRHIEAGDYALWSSETISAIEGGEGRNSRD